ncbi:putative methyltransferase-domain-containing protein [Gaertneriomyces semiglobifer]|nr:putative methyltransferase-domain-containing protein [Gaertneriomyces semiglobifer]
MARRKSKGVPVPIPQRIAPQGAGIIKPAVRIRSTQKLISTYHTLLKKYTASTKTGDHEGAAAAKTEMDAIGGLHAYQRASLKGGNEKLGKGACGRWVIPHLRTHYQARVSDGRKWRLLDVGALYGETYSKCTSWLDIESIDLNPQNPAVKKQDFFERSLPASDAERFHVVCLSLVVNFVGDPELRGKMLVLAREFLLSDGLLLLVLPLPCVTNSRYMTEKHLTGMLLSIGLELTASHQSKKLAFYLLRRIEDVRRRPFLKKEINPGVARNNFCIVLKE